MEPGFSNIGIESARQELGDIRSKKPLIHCLTNEVAMEFTADTLLAIGANPAMIICQFEAPDFVRQADALLVNVGTLTPAVAETMFYAIKAANYAKVPWVLDPVAAGLLPWRDTILKKMLSLHPTAIRGNASEILALAGCGSGGSGVSTTTASCDAVDAAKQLASNNKTIVAVTGAIDFVTDGQTTFAVDGGSPIATRITASGCVLSAMVAAFLSQTENPLLSVASACRIAKEAAAMACKQSPLPGSFKRFYLDALASL